MLAFFLFMMQPKIRRAKPTDAPDLTNIASTAKRHWGYPPEWMEHWTPELTFDAARVLAEEIWLALADDRPAAFYSLKMKEGIWWLDDLWVLPDFMGEGVGRILFADALEKCRARGADRLRIESDPNAGGFYKHMGANKIGEHRYDLDGQPRILPVLEVKL